MATLAAQFFIVWCLTKVGWFSNYSSSGVITAQKIVILGYAFDTPAAKYLLVLSIVARDGARGEEHGAQQRRAVVDGGARHGRRGRGDRHPADARPSCSAFAVSSFYCGVAGALYAYAYLGTVEPEAFNLDLSFRILFMIIIGGVGTHPGLVPRQRLHRRCCRSCSTCSSRFLDDTLHLQRAEQRRRRTSS